MATLREYFDTKIKVLAIHADWAINVPDGTNSPPITAKIALDLDGNAKYWSFFIPEGSDIGRYVRGIFENPNTTDCFLLDGGYSVSTKMRTYGYTDIVNTENLVFTKRIFLYIDAILSIEVRNEIVGFGLQYGFQVIVRERGYAIMRSEIDKPFAFISHDSRDKEGIARELANLLASFMCPVWYDEYSLKVGDSLREAIEKGLKECRKCIVILSPNFMSNGGWGKAEFDSIYTREIVEKNNVILPVWHNVTVQEVYEYSPRLADKVGLNSKLGIEELSRRLASVLKAPLQGI